ncbi:MAG TPA: hypothetical protein VE174_10585 [Actinomycetota bacterium]|nr:hypothetical protein [Actinomycetota bacterium]
MRPMRKAVLRDRACRVNSDERASTAEVLIVERDRRVRAGLARLARESGASVAVARDVVEYERYISQSQGAPSVVVVSLDHDAASVLRFISTLTAEGQRVIATASDGSWRAAAIGAGAAVVLEKDDQLPRLLITWLERLLRS